MSFLAAIGGIVADAVISKLDERLDKFFRKLEDFQAISDQKDAESLELKDMIAKAQTEEERDVLLDKMDKHLRSTIKFK